MHSTLRATMTRRFVMVAAVCLIVLALTPYAALAKTTTWTNASPSDDLWSNPGNWDNGIPSFFDIVYFDPIGGDSYQDIVGLELQEMDMTGYMGIVFLSQPLIVHGNVTVESALELNFQPLDVLGNLTVAGILNAQSASLTVGGDLYVAFHVDGSSGANITVAGSVDVGHMATLDMNNGTLELEGDLTHDPAGTSMWNSGSTLRFNGSGTQQWSAGPSGNTYGNVEIDQSPGDVVTLSAPALTVEMETLAIVSSTLDLDVGGLTVHGNVDLMSSYAELSNQTSANVALRFGGVVMIDGGTFTSTAEGCTLSFEAGGAGTVDVNFPGTFEVTGSPSNRTRLEQDGVAGGSQWELDYDGATTLIFDNVEVQDSQALPGIVSATGNSLDLGNNTGWSFPPKTTTWIGGGGTTNWSDSGNWNNGVPADNDDVLFSAVGGTSTLDIPGLQLSSLDMTGYLGTLAVNHNFDTSGDLAFDGTVTANGRAINVGGHLVILGSVDAIGSTWTTLGNIDIDGGFYAIDSFFDVDMSGAISATGSWDMSGSSSLDIGLDLTVAGGTFLASNGTVTVASDVTGTGGATLTMGSSALTVGGNLDVSGATTSWTSGGTLTFAGGSPQSWNASSSSDDYGHVQVNTGAGVNIVTLSAPGATIELDDLDIYTGTLRISDGDFTVRGDMTVEAGGTFENLTNMGCTARFEGGLTVNDGTFTSVAGGCTLQFTAGAPGTVDLNGTATFDATGSGGIRTRLEQDGVQGGTQWILDYEPTTTLTFDDVEVQDSDANPGTVSATGISIDLGNNTGWSFPPKTTAWTGAGITDNWSDSGNWNNGIPGVGDNVTFTAVGGWSILDIPGLGLNDMVMTGFLGAFDMAQPLTLVGNLTTDGTFGMAGGALDVAGHLVADGDVDATSATIAVGGNWTLTSGHNFAGSGIVMMTGGDATLSGTTDVSFGDLTVTGDMTTSVTLSASGATVTVGGSFSGASGTLTMGTGTLTVGNDADFSGLSSSSWSSGGTLRFTGGGTQGWTSGASSADFGDVEVTGGGGGGRVVLSTTGATTNLDLLDVTGGTLELAGGDLHVAGDVTVSSGATLENLTNTGATLQFDDNLQVNSGTFRCTASSCTLRFAAGASGTVDLNGTATIDVSGAPGNRTLLEQDGVAGGTQWIIDHEPGVTLTFNDVEVQDSNAQPGTIVAGGTSIGLGNNTNWSFPPKTTMWTGLGGTDNWSDGGNWNNGVPGNGDDVGFLPVGGLSVMDIAGLTLDDMNMTTFTGTLDLAQPLSVGGSLVTDGLFDMSGGDLQVAGNMDMADDVDASSGTISVGGHMTFAGTSFDGGSATIAVSGDFNTTGTTNMLISNTNVVGNMTVSGLFVGDGATITVGGSFQGVGGGSLIMSGGTLEVGGDASFGGLTSNTWAGTGQLRFTGSGTQSWTASPSTSSYGDVEVAGGGGGARVMLNSPGALTSTDDLHVTSGALELVGGDLTVGGVMTVGVGATFENLTNAGATLRIMGDLAVNNGTFRSTAGGCTIGFAPGLTAIDVDGASTFELSGTPGNRTVLEQDGVLGGMQWILDHEPMVGLLFDEVEVEDSFALPGPVVATGNSIDRGNNTNWIFPPKTTSWTNGLGTNLWSDFGNWTNGVPALGDSVLSFAVGGQSWMDIPGLTLGAMDMTNFTGTLRLDHDLDIAGHVTTSGTFDITNRTVNVGGNVNLNGTLTAMTANLTVGGSLTVTGDLDTDTGGIVDLHGTLDATPGSSLHVGNGTLRIRDDAHFDHFDFVIYGADGRLECHGTSNYDVYPGPDLVVGVLHVSHDLVSGVVTMGDGPGKLTVGDLDVDRGVLDLNVDSLFVSGEAFVRLDGTFEGLRVTGYPSITIDEFVHVSGNFSFSKVDNMRFGAGLSVTSTGVFSVTGDGSQLYFAPLDTVIVYPGATWEVIGGTLANRARLRLDGAPGSAQWYLNAHTGAFTHFENVEVGDSDASPGETQTATGDCVDLGNNDNWIFPPKTTAWTNGLGTDLWSDLGNWTNGVPALGDSVLSTAVGGLSTMDLPGLALGSLDMTNFSGTLRLDHDLDIAGFVTTSGTFALESHSVTAGGNVNVNGTLTTMSAALTVGGALHVDGDMDCDNGIVEAHGFLDGAPGSTLHVGNGTLRLHGDADLDSFGSVTFGSSGALECSGSGDHDIDIGSTIIAGNVRITPPSSSDKCTFHGSGLLTVTGDLDIDTGTLDLHVPHVSIQGTTTVSLDGKLTGSYSGGYVDFDGGIEVVGSAEYTVPRVTLRHARGSIMGTVQLAADSVSMVFSASDTFTVESTGTLQVIGGSTSSRAKLLLNGTPGSDQWHFNVRPGATTQFENIEVQDSDATPGETQTANGECIDLGNNINWNFVGTGVGDAPPTHLSLKAVPNPFNPRTTLHYGVPIAGDVTIRIYSVRGALVRTLVSAAHEPGVYTEAWNGRDDNGHAVATGVYLCRIEASGARVVRKLVLLK